jgi:MraZ protein
MALFTGTYADNRIDRKGRVSLPAKFRAELPPENNREIYIYPSSDTVALGACDRAHMEQLRDAAGISANDGEDGDYDWLLENACNVTVDSGGRIIIPTELLEYAGITETLVFVGRGHRFLVMSADSYAAYRKRALERRRNGASGRSGGAE